MSFGVRAGGVGEVVGGTIVVEGNVLVGIGFDDERGVEEAMANDLVKHQSGYKDTS